MSAHTDTAMRFYEAINAQDFDAMVALLGEGMVEHEGFPGEGVAMAPDALRERFDEWMSGVPDGRVEPLDIIDGGDKVVVRYRFTGTQTGPVMGIPATGKSFDIEGIEIMRFADGLITEHWAFSDTLRMMMQLGLMPEDAPGGSG